MSNDTYNGKFLDFIAVTVTSNPNERDHTVKIELASGALPLASKAKVDKIFSIEQTLVKRTFGQVRQDVFDDVKAELFRILS